MKTLLMFVLLVITFNACSIDENRYYPFTENDKEIYHIILSDFNTNNNCRFFIFDSTSFDYTTSPLILGKAIHKDFELVVSKIDSSKKLYHNFIRDNQKKYKLDKNLIPQDKNYSLVDTKTVYKYGLENLSKIDSSFCFLLEISRIGYDENLSKAVLFLVESRNWGTAEGHILYFEKYKDSWLFKRKILIWET